MPKGECKDCRYKNQEWCLVDVPLDDGGWKKTMELDRFCRLFDVFVPEDGYCHQFTKEKTL